MVPLINLADSQSAPHGKHSNNNLLYQQLPPSNLPLDPLDMVLRLPHTEACHMEVGVEKVGVEVIQSWTRKARTQSNPMSFNLTKPPPASRGISNASHSSIVLLSYFFLCWSCFASTFFVTSDLYLYSVGWHQHGIESSFFTLFILLHPFISPFTLEFGVVMVWCAFRRSSDRNEGHYGLT